MSVQFPTRRWHARPLTAILMFLAGAAAASADTYDPVTNELTARMVTIGAATYFNVIVTIDAVVRAPTGSSANGREDRYDSASGELTIPSVAVGNITYYNAVATVKKLVSIAGVNGADTYGGANLFIPYVQVGGAVYSNVLVSIDSVISVGNGLPTNARDLYDPVTNRLTVAAAQYGANVYTNVVVTVGSIMSVGGPSPPVTLAPDALYFSCMTSCLPQSVLLVNTGITALGIDSITLNSPKAGYHPAFVESNNCPASLGAAQSCALTVFFGSAVPYTEYHGTLVVIDAAAGSPQSVTLTGTEHF